MNSERPFSEHRDEVRRQYAREAPRYDARWSRYTRASLEPTLALLPLRRGDRVLDVGCGTGVLLERVLERGDGVRAVGADLSPDMLEAAARRLDGRAELVLATVERLPFPAGAFDLVVSTSALHHWPRPAEALREIARVTRPGGRLVLTDWNAAHLPTRLLDLWLRATDASHHRALGARALRDAVADAGYRITDSRTSRLGWRWGWITVVAVRG